MKIEQVTLSYDQKNKQLNNVSTMIPKNKITTILGPNGSGKSTLLNVISRNNRPQEGSVYIDERDILSYNPKEFAKKLSIVYQVNEIPKDLTVEGLIKYGRIPHQSLFKKESDEDKEAVNWALECTNLAEYRNRKLEDLSGGQRQRVWIALALAQKADILCLDEPTTYLDIYYQFELLELVRQLNLEYGLTIVMVLHDLNQAIRYSDHIIMMESGRVLVEGQPQEVLTEDRVKEVYKVRVKISEDEHGLSMIPISI